jgi:N-acetylmuramoyl-L-alanine amidase
MATHRVQQGECMASIAERHRFLWTTLWEHEENAALRALRKNPNALLPGDAVHIPEKLHRPYAAGTDAVHVFALRRNLVRLCLRLTRSGAPRSHEGYTLRGGVFEVTGTTASDGAIDVEIPVDLAAVDLILDASGERYRLDLGHLDPVETVTGAQARLRSLGLYSGPVDGIAGPVTTSAITGFQRSRDLPATGVLDETTSAALASAYGG